MSRSSKTTLDENEEKQKRMSMTAEMERTELSTLVQLTMLVVRVLSNRNLHDVEHRIRLDMKNSK